HALLLAVPGVTAAEPLEETPGRTAWRIAIDPARGEREVSRDVIDALLAANVRLERFGRSRPSLEQIYRRAVERFEAVGYVPVASAGRDDGADPRWTGAVPRHVTAADIGRA